MSIRKSERDEIHINLLREAIKGLADMKAGRTISLAEMRSRFGGKRLSSEQRLNKALQRLKGILKDDKRP